MGRGTSETRPPPTIDPTESFLVLLELGFRRGGKDESDLAVLCNLTTTGLVITDRTLRVQRANPAVERVFRVGPGELLGLELGTFLAPADAERLHAHLPSADTSPEASPPIVLTATASNREEFPAEFRIARLRGQGLGEYAVAIRDLRERTALVEALADKAAELARSNAELEEFVHVASHDLQEPLRMVSSYTELVRERYGAGLDADATEFLAYARDGARRMQQLLDALIRYSRLGRDPPAAEPVDLDRCLDDALANLRVALAERRATVTREPLPRIEGDPAQITELFQNLIGNAIKFVGPEPPRVAVTVDRGASEATVSVRDNGCGVPPELQPRLFVLFQRLHRRDEYPGTGIGLAVCKKIVERHGGRIWVESSGIPGEGSTFRFRLPYRRPPIPPAPAEAVAATGAGEIERQIASELIARRLQELA